MHAFQSINLIVYLFVFFNEKFSYQNIITDSIHHFHLFSLKLQPCICIPIQFEFRAKLLMFGNQTSRQNGNADWVDNTSTCALIESFLQVYENQYEFGPKTMCYIEFAYEIAHFFFHRINDYWK